MPRSVFLGAYLALSEWLEKPARRWLAARVDEKDVPAGRYEEYFGHATLPRPQSRLIWFHAASVGESLSLLDLIGALLKAQPDVRVLLTTTTPGSAEVLAQRLPERAFHQFYPVDAGPAVRRFLDHWHPDLAIWAESEFWPSLIHHTHKRGIPMLLINARISPRSAQRFRWLGRALPSLLSRFEVLMAQDEQIADRFYRLGVDPKKLVVTGSLKDSAQPLPHDPVALKTLNKGLAGRKVWLAASTHDGEEALLTDVHREVRKTAQGLLLILAPRHTDRGAALAQKLRADGWNVAVRSEGAVPDRNTEIYLADTLGEMGLWYRLASVSFIGGSLVDVGGHNPFEPALLGSAILFGPHVGNFDASYRRFVEAGAAIQVHDTTELTRVLGETLRADKAAALAMNAWTVSSESADILRQIQDTIARHLPPPRTAA